MFQAHPVIPLRFAGMEITRLGGEACTLGEGPLWHFQEQALYWIDITGKSVWRYDPNAGTVEKRWSGEEKVGALALHLDGGLVVFAGNRISVADTEFKNWRLVAELPLGEGERFNDAIVDPRGRVYFGTLWNNEEDGRLLRLEAGGEPVALLTSLGVSNGMAFSTDERIFYHTDSSTRTISAYDYDPATGEICNGRSFYVGRPEDGFPDGITMDTEGSLWVACWGAGEVLRIDPHGMIIDRVSIPARHVTSVTFGGRDLATLCVTTAADEQENIARAAGAEFCEPGGHVYCTRLEVQGRQEWRACL